MKKFAALALVATALSALPGAAQSQTARPAPKTTPAPAAPTAPAAQKTAVQIDDLGCVVRTSLQKQASKAEAADPKVTPERRAQAERIAASADRSLSYYLGRVSMLSNDPYRPQRGEAIFKAMKAAPRQQVVNETAACLNFAETQLRNTLSTFRASKQP